MDLSDLKKLIWDYTRQITENTNSLFAPLCEQYGLTMLQMRILMELYRHDFHTIGSLAEGIHVAGTNISSLCKKLEGMGLLRRIRDQKDERVVRVVLENKGQEIISEIDKTLSARFASYLNSETEESFDAIIMGLQKLTELLQKLNS